MCFGPRNNRFNFEDDLDYDRDQMDWLWSTHKIPLCKITNDSIVSQLLCSVTRPATHLMNECIFNRLNLWRHNWSSAVNFYYALYEWMHYYYYIGFGGMVHKCRYVAKWERAFPRQYLYHIMYQANDLSIKFWGWSGLRSGCRTQITIINIGGGLQSLTDWLSVNCAFCIKVA